MTTEVEKAAKRLYGPGSLGVSNIKFFPLLPGETTTPEKLAEMLKKALDQLEKGDFEEITDSMRD